jgi:hypothetical protein
MHVEPADSVTLWAMIRNGYRKGRSLGQIPFVPGRTTRVQINIYFQPSLKYAIYEIVLESGQKRHQTLFGAEDLEDFVMERNTKTQLPADCISGRFVVKNLRETVQSR